MRNSIFKTYWLAGFLIFFLPAVSAQYNYNVKRSFGETGHTITYLTYSPDGSYILTAGTDSSIIIWNAERKTIYRTLTGLEARPNMAVISADNQYVLAGGKDNIVSLWSLSELLPKIEKRYEGQSAAIKSIDVSPDNKLVAAGSADGSIIIWELGSTNIVYELKAHKENVNRVLFSSDCKTLVSGGGEGDINLWNMNNGSLFNSVKKAHKGWIRDIEYSQDEQLIVSCGDDKLIKTWDASNLSLKVAFKGHKDWVHTIDFLPDGKQLLSAGRDLSIFLWDVETGEILHKSAEEENVIISLDINPVKSDFISACYGSEKIENWALSGFDESIWNKRKNFESIAENNPLLNREQKTGNESGIELYSPALIGDRVSHNEKSIMLIGRVMDPEGVNVFLIDKQVVKLSDDGVFQYEVYLIEGDNAVKMVMVNKSGAIKEQEIIIECTAFSGSGLSSDSPENTKTTYYALLIGVNDYVNPEISDLDNPISDAQKLKDVLLANYTFEEENILFLKNPTQADLIQALDKLTKIITEKDNLLIFYAGHGYWDNKGNVGYWFPSDAARNSTLNWFRNSTLRDFIGSIESRHTLLIADACFSGAIFKTRAAFTEVPRGIEKLNKLASRKAMTSGILQEVPDESVFLKYLVKNLAENEDPFLSSEFLFSSFKTAVMNNSYNVPQYGVIQNVGDEGGDFVFVKRNNSH
ncbi:MAG: caspase family protein [Bacteroidales bacterium]|nr:caspase family protein [Bacteroidales bacterium]MCF8391723.1 caspase family protein [Bacteroidales bacterium]